ncbi:alpha/beta fold hydrolase [Streptomyces sp. NPDC020377]|uniref:alpha/beta fold hydrolase n=1 Tax=Streptomyces sp. NPDC020377 TaxID=3365070 RepID=UPI00378E2D60
MSSADGREWVRRRRGDVHPGFECRPPLNYVHNSKWWAVGSQAGSWPSGSPWCAVRVGVRPSCGVGACRWGLERPHDLSAVRQPVLVANGDSDRMVPSKNSADLARRLPHGELVIYPDAGHGGIFQFHRQFVETALEFLER